MQAMQLEARDPDWADRLQQTLMTMHGREDLPATPPSGRQNQ
ncbi:hypothetical protein GALL_306560 [mine drainage metagenome]|uniref:Uncharacterized protein n=1 Tax=mine drainage metagenome TaxID=410659 RepID=A0A1J5QUZ2_9ZZZZ